MSSVGRPAETASADTAEAGDAAPPAFRDWARGDFDTAYGRMRGAEAAIHILLPIAAAAVGMMALGIEFRSLNIRSASSR